MPAHGVGLYAGPSSGSVCARGAKEHYRTCPTRPNTPPSSISNHYTVTLQPYPQTFAPPPHIRTHKDNNKGTSPHPSPPTHIPPSSFLYPPHPVAVKVRVGMPFFRRFLICVMCVSFVAYNKYEEYLNCLPLCCPSPSSCVVVCVVGV